MVLRCVLGWVRRTAGAEAVALLRAFLSAAGLRFAAAFAATEGGRLAEVRGRFGVGAGMVEGL